MRCRTTTAFPSKVRIQEVPFTKIGRNTVQSTFMRTSLLLAYKSVRTLRRVGLDYATPAPLASQCSWWRPRRETRPFSLRLPPPSQSHPAPEVRQDFACHTSGWPREIRRGLLAAPRDLGGPLAGTADWVRVGEKSGGEASVFLRPLPGPPPYSVPGLAGVAGRASHRTHVENEAGRPAEELGRTPMGRISLDVTLHIISHLSCRRRPSQIG